MEARKRHVNRSGTMVHTSTSGAAVGSDFGSPAWPSASIRLLGMIALHAGAENAWRTAERHFAADHPIVQAFKQRALNNKGATVRATQSRPPYRVIPVMRNFKRRVEKTSTRRELCQKRYRFSISPERL